MLVERDMFIELEDGKRTGGNRTLGGIMAALPPTPLLLVSDVASALNVGNDLIYGWIDEGKFDVINLGRKDKPYYKIGRASLIEFLKKRSNVI